jgi:acyl carrier protein
MHTREKEQGIPPGAAPRNGWEGADPIEIQIKELWQEVLEGAVEDAESDFFKSGGSSLGAIYLINKIYEIYRVKIGFFAFFKIATVRKLSNFIKAGAM